MNYLLPAKRNWLLPLPTKETKMRMTTSPLSLKVAALESDMDRLEKEMAATLEKTTAAQLATARIRDPIAG